MYIYAETKYFLPYNCNNQGRSDGEKMSEFLYTVMYTGVILYKDSVYVTLGESLQLWTALWSLSDKVKEYRPGWDNQSFQL